MIVLTCGEALETLGHLATNSVDSLVVDPPSAIGFMCLKWDKNHGGRDGWVKAFAEIFKECLRVMKPGAHGLVWALPRTSHWTALALEDGGFEIRDRVSHLFSSGLPKGLNISKALDKSVGAEREIIGKSARHVSGKPEQRTEGLNGSSTFQETVGMGSFVTAPATDLAKQFDGYNTTLKPACEDWWLVRKPLDGTVAQNVEKWGVGGLNIRAGRIGSEPRFNPASANKSGGVAYNMNVKGMPQDAEGTNCVGRWPANVMFSHSEDCEDTGCTDDCAVATLDAQSGVKASRFFYCGKASKKDKTANNTVSNLHPTPKSTELMHYLIRLITPPGGIVLDAFMGSGSTGVAAIKNGFQFIGIERESAYFDIAVARIKALGISDSEYSTVFPDDLLR